MKFFLAQLVLLLCALCSVALLVPLDNAVAARNVDYQIWESQPGISDGDIHKRQELGPIIDGLSIVQLIFQVASDIEGLIEGVIDDDQARRSQFTQSLITELRTKDSSHNYVVCHTNHTYQFDGTEGVDWNQGHVEFPNTLFGTTGYDIFGFKAGTFTLVGDGGYLNWAYAGNVVSVTNDKVVVFAAPT